MTIKSRPLPEDVQERKFLHRTFNQWLCTGNEAEFAQFDAVRERFAPNEVCSVISLIRGCRGDPALYEQLPETLRQLLQERNLPPTCVGAQVL